MTTQQNRECRECSTQFPERGDDNELAYKANLCQPCKDELEAQEAERAERKKAEMEELRQRHKAERMAKIENMLADKIPLRFQRTDIKHPDFNAKAWAKIDAHSLSEEFPWLGFVGTAGKCKTRMAFRYAVKEIYRQAEDFFPKFHFVSSYEITDAVTRMNGASFEQKETERHYLDSIRKCDVLLIDDLGKGRLTPAVASELFAIIDDRYKNLAVTIWTSNTTPEAIAANLPEDMSGPFAGRLLESSKIFTFK